tara:strand:+ start:500 stop:1444 length:945 start_codon:yes stop_codon:yes gene_type:complete
MYSNFFKGIVFGSNFGFKVHYKCLKKIYNNQVAICSPNSNKKKIQISKKFVDYNVALKNNYEFISISTPPKIQKKICNLIFKKKIKPKYLILEKPICENFKEVKKILLKLNKTSINYYSNFIFVNIKEFLYFKKKIANKDLISLSYIWTFKQAYFLNKKKTWKISNKEGGGLVNFYLIHVFYNLYLLFENLEVISVNFKKNDKILTSCKISIKTNKKILINIYLDINSEKYLHKIDCLTKDANYVICNKTKDWVDNFKIYKNNKQINFKSRKVDRFNLTLENYKKIKIKKERIQNNKISEKAHYLCDQVLNFNK